MPRRSRLHAVVSAACGVWITLFSVISTAALPCAMHGSGAQVASVAEPPHSQHGSPAHAPAEDSHTAHPCRCASDCCGVSTLTLTEGTWLLVADATAIAEPSVRVVMPPRAAWGVRLLPYANGPPAAAAA